jgi:hypothetical protein
VGQGGGVTGRKGHLLAPARWADFCVALQIFDNLNFCRSQIVQDRHVGLSPAPPASGKEMDGFTLKPRSATAPGYRCPGDKRGRGEREIADTSRACPPRPGLPPPTSASAASNIGKRGAQDRDRCRCENSQKSVSLEGEDEGGGSELHLTVEKQPGPPLARPLELAGGYPPPPHQRRETPVLASGGSAPRTSGPWCWCKSGSMRCISLVRCASVPGDQQGWSPGRKGTDSDVF